MIVVHFVWGGGGKGVGGGLVDSYRSRVMSGIFQTDRPTATIFS